MVERLNGIQKVWGSTPHTSTIYEASAVAEAFRFFGAGGTQGGLLSLLGERERGRFGVFLKTSTSLKLLFSRKPPAGKVERGALTRRRKGAENAESFGNSDSSDAPLTFRMGASRKHGSRSASGRIADAIPGKASASVCEQVRAGRGEPFPAPLAPPLASRTRKPRFAGTRKYTEPSGNDPISGAMHLFPWGFRVSRKRREIRRII